MRHAGTFCPELDRCPDGDEWTAVLLEEVSSVARESSGYAASAAALERAAAISPAGRTRRLYLAAADAQLAGDEQRARSLLARADQAADGTSKVNVCVPIEAVAVARRDLGSGLSARAAAIAADAVEALWAAGATRDLPGPMSLLAIARLRAGDLGGADSSARTALSLATLTGDASAASAALGASALVGAVRGDEARVRSTSDRAAAIAGASGAIMLAEARAVLDLGAGRYDQVTSRGSHLDALECRVRAGHGLTAEETHRLRFHLHPADGPATAAAARVLGLAAHPEPFHPYFERALDLHAAMDLPFEQARTRLAYGERLRRAGHRVNARTHLRHARTAFNDLGARLWEERTVREIEVTNGIRRSGQQPAHARLTRQELEVARIIAAGATNRQAATELFVSVKTVEFHLGNIFRKLDVRNRTQLARRMPPPLDLAS